MGRASNKSRSVKVNESRADDTKDHICLVSVRKKKNTRNRIKEKKKLGSTYRQNIDACR